jgi:hypothetical protein
MTTENMMSSYRYDGDYARRSCFETFGLLMLIGLAACGASEQGAGTNRSSALLGCAGASFSRT